MKRHAVERRISHVPPEPPPSMPQLTVAADQWPRPQVRRSLRAIGDGQACSITGATVGATFPATTAGVALGAHTTTIPQYAPITLADGRVAARRDDWC